MQEKMQKKRGVFCLRKWGYDVRPLRTGGGEKERPEISERSVFLDGYCTEKKRYLRLDRGKSDRRRVFLLVPSDLWRCMRI